jgi:hypothetical protein
LFDLFYYNSTSGQSTLSNHDCVEQQQVGNDTAGVGYFKTTLQNGVVVELSASRHAGIIKYLFPSGEKYILVDISHVRRLFSGWEIDIPTCLTMLCYRLQYLPGSPGDSGSQFYVGGEIEINPNGSSYQGYGTYIGGWNNG